MQNYIVIIFNYNDADKVRIIERNKNQEFRVNPDGNHAMLSIVEKRSRDTGF